MFNPATPPNLLEVVGGTNVLDLGFFERPLSIVFNYMKGIANVTAMFVAASHDQHAIVFNCEHLAMSCT
jgi:hypothetical protein